MHLAPKDSLSPYESGSKYIVLVVYGWVKGSIVGFRRMLISSFGFEQFQANTPISVLNRITILIFNQDASYQDLSLL